MEISKILPRNGLVLVKRYTMPAHYSEVVSAFNGEAISVNPAWGTDMNRDKWEAVRSTPGADREFGLKILPDDILFTLPNRGVFLCREGGEDYFLLSWDQIEKCWRWKEEEVSVSEDDMMMVCGHLGKRWSSEWKRCTGCMTDAPLDKAAE